MENLELLLIFFAFYRLRNLRREQLRNHRRRRLRLLVQQRNQMNLLMLHLFASRMVFYVACLRRITSLRNRRFWTVPRPPSGWFELIFADDSQSRYWKEHFRMSKETFRQLVDLVAPLISRRNTRLREAISTPKRVAIALWRLAGGTSFREVATQFDVGKSSCVAITKEFCQALNTFSRRFIKFPSNTRETTRAIALFQDECGIPQAVGAIDGTHIEIIAPENPFDYFDRQQRYSVIMQAVVGENLKFLDTAIGYPGSMHDSRVLRNSELYRKATNGDILTAPVRSMNGIQIKPLLIGDGAYPLLPWLIKPYPNVNLNANEQRFNRTLSSARSTVERAFGHLKGRWRILLKRLDNKFVNVPETILTCCILHNFCQEAGEEFDDQEVLRRVVEIERRYLQARRQQRAIRNPAGAAIRQTIQLHL